MSTPYTFAVLVDGENAQAQLYSSTLNEVEKYGTIAIKWVYADWTSPHHKNWQDILHETASRPKQQFHYGKDAADHALVMDAIELIGHNARINAVCIVSSDGGFYSLAQRIREHGLHVMAVGRQDTPQRFKKACHNFVFLDNLDAADDDEYQNINISLDDLLLKAYRRLVDNQDPVYLGDMGTMLKSLDSSFDHRSHGHRTLKKLVNARNDLFEIVGEQDDRCFITLKHSKRKEGTIRLWKSQKQFGFIRTDEGDYHFKAESIDDNVDLKNIRKGVPVNFCANQDSNTNINGKCPEATFITFSG